MDKIQITIITGVCLLMLMVFLIRKRNSTKSKQMTLPELTEEEFKIICKEITYEKLARFPDRYVNAKIKITGKAFNVNGANERINAFLGVEPEINYNCRDLRFKYLRKYLGEPRFLDGDIITIYGIYAGLKTYTTVMNAENTLPYVHALYLEIHPIGQKSGKTDKKEKVSNLKSA